MVPLYTNTLGAKTKDHAQINGLPDGQSSWNFVRSLLASIPNKRDPYWVNPSMFWKWLILLYVTWSRDRAKMWLWPISFKFTWDVDSDRLNRFGRPGIVKINFGPIKVDLTAWCQFLTIVSHWCQVMDHAPINGLPDGQSSWNFVRSLLASIPNKRDPYWVNPSMFWKWLILLYVTWSRDRAKMWPWPIFFKFTRDVDIDPLNRFGRPEIVKINFGPKKVHLTSGATLHQYIGRKN